MPSFSPEFWKRSGASNLVGGIAKNEIKAIGSGSAEAEAVEATPKPTASKTLLKTTWSQSAMSGGEGLGCVRVRVRRPVEMGLQRSRLRDQQQPKMETQVFYDHRSIYHLRSISE